MPAVRPPSPSPLNPFAPAGEVEVTEGSGDTAWNEFSELARQQEARFAPTAPASLTPEFTAYARTAPMGLPTTRDDAPAAPVQSAAPRITLDLVMLEARRNNRVCPRPEHWLRLYEMLPGRTVVNGKQHPPPPISGAAWKATPSLPKRMCFREHLEWAEKCGALQPVHTLLKLLPEEEWLHMGEE